MTMQDGLNKYFVAKWREVKEPNVPPVPIIDATREFVDKIKGLMPDMGVEVKLIYGDREWTRKE